MSNRIIEFGNEICEQLEYKLTEVFRSPHFLATIPGWWCDGFEPQQCNLEELLESRIISTNCYIGKDGQSRYKASIWLGNHILRKISKQNVVILEAVELRSKYPVKLDQDNRAITVYLR